MRRAVVAVLLVLVPLGVCAELTLSTGGSAELLFPGPQVGGGIRVGGSGTWYRPLPDEFGFLLEAAGTTAYLPAAAEVSAGASASGDLSLLRGAFLGRLRLGAIGQIEASVAGLGVSVLDGELSAALLLSWEALAASVLVEPSARLNGGDRILWSAGLRVEASGALGSMLILSADLQGALDVPAEGSVEPVVSLSTGIEWFPDAPLHVGLEAGTERRFSAAVYSVETAAGAAVQVPGFWGYLEARGALSLSALLGPRSDVTLRIPCDVRWRDHGVIDGTVLLPEREWDLELAPGLELGVELSRALAASVSLDYRLALGNGLVATHELGVSAELRLRLP